MQGNPYRYLRGWIWATLGWIQKKLKQWGQTKSFNFILDWKVHNCQTWLLVSMPTKFPKPLEKLQWRETIFFKLWRNFWSHLEFANKDCSVIGPERSLHPFEQCHAKLKLIVIWFPAFRGASLVHFFFNWIPFGFLSHFPLFWLAVWFFNNQSKGPLKCLIMSSLWSHIFLLHSCNEPGMGPLMRDVKNKICTGN